VTTLRKQEAAAAAARAEQKAFETSGVPMRTPGKEKPERVLLVDGRTPQMANLLGRHPRSGAWLRKPEAEPMKEAA